MTHHLSFLYKNNIDNIDACCADSDNQRGH